MTEESFKERVRQEMIKAAVTIHSRFADTINRAEL